MVFPDSIPVRALFLRNILLVQRFWKRFRGACYVIQTPMERQQFETVHSKRYRS
jgi:hypothetical protein